MSTFFFFNFNFILFFKLYIIVLVLNYSSSCSWQIHWKDHRWEARLQLGREPKSPREKASGSRADSDKKVDGRGFAEKTDTAFWAQVYPILRQQNT